MPSTTVTEPMGRVDPGQAARLDSFVERAQAAAQEFRRLDQEAVDRIVWAMVVAGLESAVELAELFARVDELLDAVEIPRSLAETDVPREEFEAALPDLARAAFMDPSIRTNPRIPLIGELIELLRSGYEGRPQTKATQGGT